MRIISLRTQPGCQEENSAARNLGALLGHRYLGQRDAPSSLFPARPQGMSMGRHWPPVLALLPSLLYRWSARQPPLERYSGAKPGYSEVWRWPRTVRIL